MPRWTTDNILLLELPSVLWMSQGSPSEATLAAHLTSDMEEMDQEAAPEAGKGMGASTKPSPPWGSLQTQLSLSTSENRPKQEG